MFEIDAYNQGGILEISEVCSITGHQRIVVKCRLTEKLSYIAWTKQNEYNLKVNNMSRQYSDLAGPAFKIVICNKIRMSG